MASTPIEHNRDHRLRPSAAPVFHRSAPLRAVEKRSRSTQHHASTRGRQAAPTRSTARQRIPNTRQESNWALRGIATQQRPVNSDPRYGGGA